MDPVTAPAAPAQPPAPETISASVDALNRSDFSAFDSAELAKRDGKPLPDVAVANAPAPDVPAAPTPDRQVSKRQQQINDYERTIAELRAENARLVVPPAAPAAPRSAAHPPAPAAPTTWQDAIARPDVAQALLSEAQFFQQYPDAPYAAYGRYWGEYDHAKATVDAQSRAHAEESGRFLHERATSLSDKLQAAKTADPDFLTKLPPALLDPQTSLPLSALPAGSRATFTNVVAEAALHADHPVELLTHLHAHPEVAQQIAAMPQRSWLLALARLDGSLTSPAASVAVPAADPSAAVPSPVSAAPPPATTLRSAGSTSDPKGAALARGDFAEFDRLEVAERLAKTR